MRPLLAMLQFVLVGGALLWLFKLAGDQTVIDLASLGVATLTAAILTSCCGLFAMGLRLVCVCRGLGLALNVRAGFILNLRSVFYGFILPLGLGIEAARYYAFAGTFAAAPRGVLVRALLLDRTLGVLTALLLGLVAAAGIFTTWSVLIGVSGVFGVFLAGLTVLTIARPFSVGWLPFLGAAICSVLLHLFTYLSILILASGIEIPTPPVETLLAMSAGVLGAVVPFMVAGAGAGDLLFAGVLVGFDLAPLQAAMIAAAAYLTRLLGAVIGAFLELAEGSLLARLLRPRS